MCIWIVKAVRGWLGARLGLTFKTLLQGSNNWLVNLEGLVHLGDALPLDFCFGTVTGVMLELSLVALRHCLDEKRDS